MPGGKRLWWAENRGLRRELLHLAWPAMLEQVMVTLVTMISTAMMGHVATAALSAVGVVNRTFMVIQALMAVLAMGVAIVVAHAMGANDHKSAVQATRQAMFMGVIASLAVPVVLFLIARPMLALFFGHADADIVENGVTYFLWQLPGIPMFILNLVISGALRGSGQMRQPMFVAFLVNVVFTLLGSVLIFGFWFIPPLGVKGAGLAMSVARTVGGLMSIAFLFGKHSQLRFPLKTIAQLEKAMFKRIMRFGVPAALEQMAFSAGLLLVQIVMTSVSMTELAAYQVVNTLCDVPYNVVFGFGTAAMTLVGQYLGAKQPEKAERAGWQALLCTLLAVVPAVTLLVLAAEPLGRLYTDKADVLHVVVGVMPWIFWVYAGGPLANVTAPALRSAGDGFFVSWTNLASVMLIRVGCTYILLHVFHLGVESVYITMGGDVVLRGIIYVLRFRRGRWKTRLL